MNEQLIIRLPEQADQAVAWLIAAPNSALSGSQDRSQTIVASGVLKEVAELSQLTEHARQREVVIAVAGEAVSLYEVSLPTKVTRQWHQLIPYALEEEVAEDLENLHFAWPPQGAAEALPVLVVRHSQMAFWQSCLAQANITARHWLPDYLLLPAPKQGTENNKIWSVTAFGEQLCIRQGAWAGFSMEAALLNKSLAHLAEPPTQLNLYGEVAALSPQDCEEQGISLVDQGTELVLQEMLKNSFGYRWSLCQGQYQVEAEQRFSWQFLKFPVQCAALFVAVFLLYTLTHTWQLQKETQATEQRIATLYQELFPQQSRMPPDARQKIQALAAQSSGQHGEFLHFLNELEAAFASSQIELTVLQYEREKGELRIQATGASFQVFNKLQEQLRAEHLDVEQGQLMSRAGKIAGTLTFRRAYVDEP